MAPSLSGRLLVAAPQLHGSAFARAVILMLDHAATGALGVVLNRPSDLPVREVLPAWGGSVTGDPVVFEGGPVDATSALALATVGPAAAEQAPLGWRPVAGLLGLVDLDAPVELLCEQLTAMRVFAGYAGWSGQQLEAELADGSWYVVAAESADVFSTTPASLWRTVLRRQPGPISLLSTYPDDPSLN